MQVVGQEVGNAIVALVDSLAKQLATTDTVMVQVVTEPAEYTILTLFGFGLQVALVVVAIWYTVEARRTRLQTKEQVDLMAQQWSVELKPSIVVAISKTDRWSQIMGKAQPEKPTCELTVFGQNTGNNHLVNLVPVLKRGPANEYSLSMKSITHCPPGDDFGFQVEDNCDSIEVVAEYVAMVIGCSVDAVKAALTTGRDVPENEVDVYLFLSNAADQTYCCHRFCERNDEAETGFSYKGYEIDPLA